MKSALSTIALAIASAGLGGCVNLNYPLSTESGKFATANFDAQVVDAAPAEGAPEQDAAMADAAYDRYRNDEVKKPFEEEAGQEISLGFSPN